MSSIVVAGDTSGSITISAPAVSGSNTLSLPAVTDTLAGIAATQTLTNKTLVAPALGTPASGVLTNCTGVPAAALPAGSVLQVVQGSLNIVNGVASSSSTLSDLGLSATITPRSASNKVLIFTNLAGCNKETTNTYLGVWLLRGASIIQQIETLAGYTNTAGTNSIGAVGSCFLDSPATTSSTTYKIQINSGNNTGTVHVGYPASGIQAISQTITLMEIAG